jgi:ABC-type Zn2+ transport system substrate-binding protein/surface adhesin
LLLGYGFVLSPNPDDVLPLRLGGLGSNVSENKKARLAAKSLDAGKRWIIKRDGQIERDLMEVLRIVMGEDNPHDHDHDEEDEDEEEEHGHWEEEMELELDVLGALGQMLDDKLAKLEGVDTEVEARKDVKAMCEIYRRGELYQC